MTLSPESDNKNMPNETFNHLLRKARRLLSFHLSLGINNYPKTPGITSFLEDTSQADEVCSERHPSKKHPNDRPKTGTKPQPVQTAQTEKSLSLEETMAELGACTRCRLHEQRSHLVFGCGNPLADLFIVGEYPAPDDNQTGQPFQGEAGALLDKMLAAIKLNRQDVYLANLVKCMPPENRAPETDELRTCLPFLHRQIAAVSPKIICAMGSLTAQTLLGSDKSLFQLRGRFHNLKNIFGGRAIPVIPTMHPAFLLKNEEMKKASWEDLLKIQNKLRTG